VLHLDHPDIGDVCLVTRGPMAIRVWKSMTGAYMTRSIESC